MRLNIFIRKYLGNPKEVKNSGKRNKHTVERNRKEIGRQ